MGNGIGMGNRTEQERQDTRQKVGRKKLDITQHVKVCMGTQNAELVLNLVHSGEKALTAFVVWLFQINSERKLNLVLSCAMKKGKTFLCYVSYVHLLCKY